MERFGVLGGSHESKIEPSGDNLFGNQARPFTMLGLIGLVIGACTLTSCADAPQPEFSQANDLVNVADDSAVRFTGTWELIDVERRNADGEILPADPMDRLGYLMYDPAGYMGVVIQTGDREVYASANPTPEEAHEALRTYTSYFGTFSIDEAAGEVTHHLRGSLHPSGVVGSNYVRGFEFSEDLLTLQPPSGPSGIQSRLTWQRVPDQPELTPEHQRFIGFWEIDSIERRTESGESLSTEQFADGFVLYTSSGHMAVHLMRAERRPPEGTQLTSEEALEAMRSYASYFGPVSLHEAEGYIVHHVIGQTNPGGIGTDAQRYYEFTDNQLILKPPPTTIDGELVQGALTWTRISR